MAYYRDFSGYRYLEWRPDFLNVGWLDASQPFETSSAPEDVVARLWSYCEWSIWETRGYHRCNLPGCENQDVGTGPVTASRGSTVLKLGVAEIRVFGNDGKIYAAPNLIYHYVTVHGYKMPDEFILALKEGPSPDSAEYFDRLRALGLEWVKTLRIGGR